MDRSSPHDGRPLAQATGGNGLDCPFHYGEALHAARLQGLCAGKAGAKASGQWGRAEVLRLHETLL